MSALLEHRALRKRIFAWVDTFLQRPSTLLP
jgi:hypothetical protein